MGWLSPRFLPGANVCRSFLWLPRDITLLATMYSGDVGHHAVTLSSSTNLKYCFNFELEITGTGVLGVGTGRWRLNGGAWTNFTLQAVVALAGTTFSLNFAAGSYASGWAYRSVIDTISDDRSNAWVATSGAASVYPFVGSVNGRPTIRTNGVDRFFRTATSSLSTALMGGIRTPMLICGAFRYNGSLTPGVNQAVMAYCNGASGQAVFQLSVAATTGFWRVSKRGDTGGTTAVDSAVQATNNPLTFALWQTGTNVSLEIGGVTVINNLAQNVAATLTVPMFEIGASHTTGAPSEFWSDVDWMGHAAYTGIGSAAIRTRARQFWKNLYGLAA